MNITELASSLLAEGCNRNVFQIGECGGSDVFCLVQKDGIWQVFYTERGHHSPPIFTSESEIEACDFFYQHVLAQEHWHLVGWFVDQADAVALEARIGNLGVKPRRNDINYYGFKVDTYRVFVMGKDIFPVVKAIPEIAIVKDPRGSKNSKYVRNLRYIEYAAIAATRT